MRRSWIATLALLAVPFLGVPAWIALNRADAPSPDDADLMRTPTPVDPEQDAFRGFQVAGEAVSWDETTDVATALRAIERGETENPEWVAGLVHDNAEAFRGLEKALAAPEIRIPPFGLDGSPDDPVLVLFRMSLLARIAALDAQLQAEAGRTELALERAILGLRLGHKLGQAPDLQLVDLMVATTSQRFGLQAIARLAARGHLDAADRAALARRIESLRVPEDAWKHAWASEYRFVKRSFEENFADYDPREESPEEPTLLRRIHGWVPPSYSFQKNRTLALLADEYRILQANRRRDCADAQPAATDMEAIEAPTTFPGSMRLLLTPNYGGRFALRMAVPQIWRFDARRCQQDAAIALVRTLLAIDAFRAEHGGVPQRLGELVPAYLDAVPRDRFDGQPLRWAPEAGVLYSVGEDLVDRGAPNEPSLETLAAPALRVPTAS